MTLKAEQRSHLRAHRQLLVVRAQHDAVPVIGKVAQAVQDAIILDADGARRALGPPDSHNMPMHPAQRLHWSLLHVASTYMSSHIIQLPKSTTSIVVQAGCC